MSEPMIAPLWTSDDIAKATKGQPSVRPFAASGVTIDTRSLDAGDLFVALEGERNGHDFLGAAYVSGASGVLVSTPGDRDTEIRVADTQAGLEALAEAARERSRAMRAAVTGSVGKTSVTQAIGAAIRLAGHSHAPEKSFNNHIGVPLTLARMPANSERAVFELGMNHAGEIAALSRLVRPHVAVVVAVGPVHVENFTDGEAGVARAKAEIFEGLTPGGLAVLNRDDPWFDLLAASARNAGARIMSFGRAETCDAQLIGFEPTPSGAEVVARLHGRALRFPLVQSGAHWGPNSLAVLLACEALETPLDATLEALSAFAPLQGRGAEQIVVGPSGAFVVIDESYNANPISMRAAIDQLGARRASGRRIVALTDMLELGVDAERLHRSLGEPLEAANVDLVFCAGSRMRALWDVVSPARRGLYAETAESLAPALVDAIRPGDVVMVKGSNGSKASLLAHALTRVGGSPPASGSQA